MTEIQPQIISSNVAIAETKGKELLISRGNNAVDVLNLTTIPILGGWQYTESSPQTEAAASTMQWNINLDPTANINT